MGATQGLPHHRTGTASQQYVVTDIGTLGGDYTQARAINAAGQVVGWSFPTGSVFYHAFLWSNGSMQDIGSLSISPTDRAA
jgi:probable HAF family extracellular repeat protein